MPKRFTDSEKFRDPWYRKLSPKHKCLWEYLISECSLSGIIELDFEMISFLIGDEITQDDIEAIGDRVYYLDDNKLFIPKFVEFQQVKLNPENKAHQGIIRDFERYGIPIDLDMSKFQRGIQGGSKGDRRGPGIGNSIGNGNGNSNTTAHARESNSENSDAMNECEAHPEQTPSKWHSTCQANVDTPPERDTALREYNLLADELGLPKAQKLTEQRRKSLDRRLRDCGGIEGWREALQKVRESPFLCGDNDRGWKANLDFLLRESSFTKLMEGAYSDSKQKGKPEDELAEFLGR